MKSITKTSTANVQKLLLSSNVDLTRSKYNGGQLYAIEEKRVKYCINPDWFEITTKGIILQTWIETPPQRIDFPDSDIYLELTRKGAGTRHYRFVYEAFAKGDEHSFATVLTAPRQGGVLDADFSQIRVLNHALYTEGWTKKLYSFLCAANLKINNNTRLDIAIDGHGLLSFILQYDNGSLDKLGRVSKYTLHKENRELTGYDWGSRKGEKYITCYNKSKRLESSEENKSYIREFWRKNELDTSTDVERFELKMKAKVLDKIVDPETGEKGIDILRLEDSQYLAGIVESQLENFFQFVLPGSDTNVTRKKKAGTVEIIDFEALKGAKMVRLSTTKPSSEKYRAKIAAKKILDDNNKNNYLKRALRAYFRETGYWTMPDEIIDEIPAILAVAMANEHDAGAWLRKHIDRPPAQLIKLKAAV